MSNSDQSHEAHADGIIEAGKKVPFYFYLLFFGLIAWGVVFIGYFLFSGWNSHSEFDEKMATHTTTYNQSDTAAATPLTASTSIDAKKLFASYCSGCHGEDGKGGYGSDLSSPSYKYGRDTDTVKTSIADGREGRMPSFGNQLKDDEIAALAEYVLNIK
ncbi:c-type cytochrome [Malonomonas rubra]|uniref:c-type cytochrome n=1 Tax=Malonomonas rubra TaxID=57040 RepID=UPI0026ECBB14|nr:c-type cytochrome [Malonomonas rubra]